MQQRPIVELCRLAVWALWGGILAAGVAELALLAAAGLRGCGRG